MGDHLQLLVDVDVGSSRWLRHPTPAAVLKAEELADRLEACVRDDDGRRYRKGQCIDCEPMGDPDENEG